MNSGYKLIPKMVAENWLDIYFVINRTGETRLIARIECPSDKQMNDNLTLADDIMAALRKRIKRSL